MRTSVLSGSWCLPDAAPSLVCSLLGLPDASPSLVCSLLVSPRHRPQPYL